MRFSALVFGLIGVLLSAQAIGANSPPAPFGFNGRNFIASAPQYYTPEDFPQGSPIGDRVDFGSTFMIGSGGTSLQLAASYDFYGVGSGTATTAALTLSFTNGAPYVNLPYAGNGTLQYLARVTGAGAAGATLTTGVNAISCTLGAQTCSVTLAANISTTVSGVHVLLYPANGVQPSAQVTLGNTNIETYQPVTTALADYQIADGIPQALLSQITASGQLNSVNHFNACSITVGTQGVFNVNVNTANDIGSQVQILNNGAVIYSGTIIGEASATHVYAWSATTPCPIATSVTESILFGPYLFSPNDVVAPAKYIEVPFVGATPTANFIGTFPLTSQLSSYIDPFNVRLVTSTSSGEPTSGSAPLRGGKLIVGHNDELSVVQCYQASARVVFVTGQHYCYMRGQYYMATFTGTSNDGTAMNSAVGCGEGSIYYRKTASGSGIQYYNHGIAACQFGTKPLTAPDTEIIPLKHLIQTNSEPTTIKVACVGNSQDTQYSNGRSQIENWCVKKMDLFKQQFSDRVVIPLYYSVGGSAWNDFDPAGSTSGVPSQYNVMSWYPQATLTSASITGTSLTATVATGTPANGMVIVGTGVTKGTTISSVSVVGTALTATTSVSQSVASTSMTAAQQWINIVRDGNGLQNFGALGCPDVVMHQFTNVDGTFYSMGSMIDAFNYMQSPAWKAVCGFNPDMLYSLDGQQPLGDPVVNNTMQITNDYPAVATRGWVKACPIQTASGGCPGLISDVSRIDHILVDGYDPERQPMRQALEPAPVTGPSKGFPFTWPGLVSEGLSWGLQINVSNAACTVVAQVDFASRLANAQCAWGLLSANEMDLLIGNPNGTNSSSSTGQAPIDYPGNQLRLFFNQTNNATTGSVAGQMDYEVDNWFFTITATGTSGTNTVNCASACVATKHIGSTVTNANIPTNCAIATINSAGTSFTIATGTPFGSACNLTGNITSSAGNVTISKVQIQRTATGQYGFGTATSPGASGLLQFFPTIEFKGSELIVNWATTPGPNMVQAKVARIGGYFSPVISTPGTATGWGFWTSGNGGCCTPFAMVADANFPTNAQVFAGKDLYGPCAPSSPTVQLYLGPYAGQCFNHRNSWGSKIEEMSLSLVQLSAGLAVANGYLDVVPTTGQSLTIPATGINHYQISPAGTLAALTITMPAAFPSNQVLTIGFDQAITTFTLNGNTGQTVNGAPTSAAANTAVKFLFDGTVWHRQQ